MDEVPGDLIGLVRGSVRVESVQNGCDEERYEGKGVGVERGCVAVTTQEICGRDYVYTIVVWSGQESARGRIKRKEA